MTLRARALLTSAVIVVVGAVLAATVGSWVVLHGFQDLEQAAAERDLDRAQAALDADLDNLAALAGDWSAWNDTYDFVTDASSAEDYVDSNLRTGTFVGLGLHLIVITDRATDVHYAGAVDLAAEEPVDPTPLVERLRSAGLLRPFGVLDDHRTGLLRVGDDLLMLSVRPITDTAADTRPSGTLTMARWVDDRAVAALSERTSLDLDVDPSAAEIIGVTTRTSPTTITTARTLRGIAGEPVVELSVTEPRPVLAQGRSSVRMLVMVVVGVLGVVGLLLLVVADRQVLRRLRRLGAEIAGLGGPDPEATRVTEDAVGDEISDVARALNKSLGALERARQDVQLRNVELQHTNVELAATNHELDTANRQRRRFLSAVSHDLRTPLTSIRGFVTLLRDRWDDLAPEQRRDFFERIESGTSTMDAMVEDLLMLSRLEQGAMVGEPTTVHLRDFLPEVIAHLPGEDVEVVRAEGQVEIDPDHLRRVLANLVDNAHKYGEPPVHVAARVVDDTVELRVRDHGPGVEEDFEDALFEAFSQARPGRGIEEGVGLGLSIVQHLSSLHGGTVSYERSVQPGACFLVRLPRAELRSGVDASSSAGSSGLAPRR